MAKSTALQLAFFRFAAKGFVPPAWFEPNLPAPESLAARTGRLRLEIVSHCWRYAHLLVYQLSSLVLFPPREADITMTVFYSPEDEQTCALLDFFAKIQVPGVEWNWRPLPKEKLFRRSIGRNLAALKTRADWVWFTDCDLMFRDNCLDSLAQLLQGRREVLFYPREERCTDLLAEDNPLLARARTEPAVLDINPEGFVSRYPSRATGPLQITHGDVCRQVGYCRSIGIYQQPVEQFAKCHEDRAFRWLLRSQGIALPVDSVYRIRHVHKGRYEQSGATGRAHRTLVRQVQERIRGWMARTGRGRHGGAQEHSKGD
ncbi:MAG: glycosyltransferase family A protein [Halothiobacillaceae bacterium]